MREVVASSYRCTLLWRHALVGLLTAYGARAFFVWYSVSIAQSGRWIEGGTQVALDHVLRGGSIVSLLCCSKEGLEFVGLAPSRKTCATRDIRLYSW